MLFESLEYSPTIDSNRAKKFEQKIMPRTVVLTAGNLMP